MLATLGRLSFSGDGKKADLKASDGFVLNVHLAESLSSATSVTMEHPNRIVAKYDVENVRLEVTVQENSGIEFYNFSWFSLGNLKFLKDTICLGKLEDVQWFGGAQVLQQTYPLLKTDSSVKGYDFCPYVISDPYMKPASGHERYWLCSKKLALFVPSAIPLWTNLSQNGFLTFQSQFDDSPYKNFRPESAEMDPFLAYTVVVADDKLSLKEFHLALSKVYLDHPKNCIDDLLVEKPIWTTWSRYGKFVNQKDVLDFVDEIEKHKFSVSQIELDDKWTTEYGDFEIDTVKFPSFKSMVDGLKAKNIRLTAWIHPFVNLQSKNAQNSEIHSFFVQDSNGSKPRTTKWWNGEGYVVDFTNPSARNWFRENLERLRNDFGIFTYKFDAGEVYYLPDEFRLYSAEQPNDYSRSYANFAAEFGTAVEDRVGSGNQALPLLIRTLDRLSRWIDTGLSTLIPSALHFSLHGYFWNLPDIIGGNGAEMSEIGNRKVRTDSELFIRWVQANAFLLVLQFSFCPWDYVDADDIVAICHSVLQQREKKIDYIKAECRKSVNLGIPLIRPLWWEMETKAAFLCDDEFFVGDQLLVAPIVREKTFSRQVLLPAGKWTDELGNHFTGPKEISIEVPLQRIPHFWREKN
uniref:Glycoside hydrolase family 31 n=1 Tax=Panagrolaimus sp. JU765 TaxID=591449 RepID=A0AC34PWC2_9BILA